MSTNEVVWNLRVDLETVFGDVENLRSHLQDTLRLAQQMITVMRRGGFGENQRQWLDSLSRLMAVAQLARLAVTGPAGAVTAGFGLIGIMSSMSEYPTVEALMSSVILDSDMEARMRR